MAKFRTLALVLALALLTLLAVSVGAFALPDEKGPAPESRQATPQARQQPIIVDHEHTDLSQVPDYWIQQARSQLRIWYAHTSHGSQLVSGMDSVGLEKPPLEDIDDKDLGHVGDTSWVAPTRNHLDTHPGVNLVMWSWCAGVSDNTEEGINTYLNAMNELEGDYPDVTFVYMTGHLDGGGVEGNLNVRNNQIRDYCRDNNKVLFDFADIESYDPDGAEFLSRLALDTCQYDGNSNGDPTDDGANWADEWCAGHPTDPLCDDCYCAHSEPLNCNLKGRAVWWMLARIAGWSGPQALQFTKVASQTDAFFGETVSYTLVLDERPTPTEGILYLKDTLPPQLTYVPGSLDSTLGIVTDTTAPELRWSGDLSPTGIVTITYAVTVNVVGPETVTNTAVLSPTEGELSTAQATLTVTETAPTVDEPYKSASVTSADQGDLVTYTLYICNSFAYTSAIGLVSDTIPPELAYVPDTLTATGGTVTATQAPTLYWRGVLSPMSAITVSYAATVVTTETGWVVNHAEYLWSVPSWPGPIPEPVTYTLEAAIIVNPYRVFLPVTLKNSP